MTFTTIQNGFVAGELSPSLYGRTDLAKYHQGAFTMRNFFVNYRGGAASRAGTAYVGTCKQPGTAAPPRDIPFQFSITQGYALEFGDQYMRIKSRGAYVVEPTKAITGATQAFIGALTIPSHGYSVGDWIYILGMGGMTEFNNLTWIVGSVPNSNSVTLTDLFGNAVNTSGFPAYTSGGTAARLYTLVTPYAAVDLPYLKFTQSADTMTLTCVNTATSTEYPSYELVRHGATNWTLTPDTFATSIAPPTGLTATAQSSTTLSTFYSYVVTAVSSATGEESVASAAVTVENNDIAINAGSNTINWAGVSGASSYNVYKATPAYQAGVPVGALYGYMGTAFGNSLTDTNITADFTKVPPTHQNPFARGAILQVTPTAGGSGYTQSNIGYTVNTSTGSGFVGVAIASTGGQFVGFLIQNGGQGYAATDTISITGGGAFASGTFTFTVNPTDGDTLTLNGVVWTFVSSIAGSDETLIGGSLASTLASLAIDLTASTDAGLTVAKYTASTTVLTITYKTSGSGGNAYTLSASVATRSGPTLTGGGASGGGAATLTVGPQIGTYPGTCAYYQQRRAYAASLNNPDTYWMSQPGAFSNMDSSIPITDSDAITGTPWAQQVNGVQFMVPMPGGLVVLTGKGAWQVNGGNSAALTPSNQDASPQAYNGCNDIVPPIVVNYDILYLQAKGSIFRDLSYNFFVNIYTGTDLTVLSNHLFSGYTFTQWCWSEEPYKLAWAVRNDGELLSLTYLKEQDVYAWARHDTNGLFVGCCSITEPPVDAVYLIVKRYVSGRWTYYSERMDDRIWPSVESTWCVDAGLSYPVTEPNAVLTPSAAEGTANISSVDLIEGGSGYTSPLAFAQDPTGSGSGASFTVTVAGGVITAITPVAQGQNYAQGTQIIVTDPTGTGALAQAVVTNYVPFTASASVFGSGNIGDVIRVGGGRATVVSVSSGTSLIANITAPITMTLPDDTAAMPVPAQPGSWSISTPTTVVSGLNHLEGKTVSILADGSVQTPQAVSGGAITLPHAASQILVGLPFVAQLQTSYLDPPGQPVTSQSKRKNVSSVSVRAEASRGISVGTNQPDAATEPNGATIPWANMVEIKERNATVQAGAGIPLFTGDIFVNVPADWNTNGQIAVQQPYPLPANILSVVAYYTVGDSSG